MKKSIFKPDVILTNKQGNELILPLDQNKKGIFCQHYLYLAKVNGVENFDEMHDFTTRKFTLPKGMTADQAFKVLSFLTNYVEKTYSVQDGSAKSVQIVDNLIEDFGFCHIESAGETPFRFIRSNFEPCTHLFTVNGQIEYFDQSQYEKDYFEWFSEGVKLEDVKQIYQNLGLKIPDSYADIVEYEA